jgi:DNA-binding LytR/AlgR family response regulator
MDNSKLRILIIEDELLIAEMLKEMLFDLNYQVVGIAKNYELAEQYLRLHPQINFAILDINLSEQKTGFDVAKLIQANYNIPFIFLTSYSTPDTIKEAIGLKPQSYLIKPFTKTDLFVTLELIAAKQPQGNESIVIKDGHLSVKLFFKDMLWIKSENIYLEIKTTEKTYLIRNSLDKFLEEIKKPNFIRIHRSYAVNINYVKAVNGQYVIIGAEKIPMSRSLRDELILKFNC